MLRLVERIPDEAAAYEYLEGLRWDGKPECPHCGNDDRCYFLNPANGKSRQTRTGAASQRRVWKCGACRKQFSVLTNTVMHGTKIPVRVWVFVIFEMCLSKNGMAAREIERKYGIAPRSAWFMTQRIREAMASGGIMEPMEGVIVADETFIGGAEKNKHTSKRSGVRGPSGKTVVLTLIESHTGRSRSRVIPDVSSATLEKALTEQVHVRFSTLYTDENHAYRRVGRQFLAHETVNHSEDEYVRRIPGRVVSTNRAESFFAQLKRSIDGTHHHVSRKHLHRYLAEFDYRHSTRDVSDGARMANLVSRVGGRRLTYRPLTSSASS
jgi:transposase-like protein